MASVTPSPLTLTLRFKYQKSTTLLHVDPLQSLDSVKTELLRALRAVHPDGRLPNGSSIPSKSTDVSFGLPVDVHDLSQGWKSMEGYEDEVDEDMDLGSKTSKNSKTARSAIRRSTPTALGLKDGSVVAYKFTTDEELLDEGIGGVEDGQWGVVLPSMD